MACYPGTPCFGSGNVTYPRGCGVDPCVAVKSNTDLVFYSGGNLPCTGVQTCDSLTLALQKLDEAICQLQAAITTTTSTTTAAPCQGPGVPVLLFAHSPGNDSVGACANYNASARTIYYVSSACASAPNLEDCNIYLDCAMTIPASADYVYVDGNGWWYQLSTNPLDGFVVTWGQC
jgi:hypothetical protein